MAEQLKEMLLGSATAASEMLRSGQISSRELTKLTLARIDARNPSLNAVVELRPEALQAAAADELTARGEVIGPLHGVPVTIKEAFQVIGMHSTWGISRSGILSLKETPTVVRRLRRLVPLWWGPPMWLSCLLISRRLLTSCTA